MKVNIIVYGLSLILTAFVCLWFFKNSVNANQPTTIVPLSASQNQSIQSKFEVSIRGIGDAPRVLTDETDSNGNPVTVSCSTCHQTRKPNFENTVGEDMDEFHQGLTMQHGNLSCLSCHNNENYDTLRLSDGRKVQYKDVMTLCAQCHGPQFRDYENGAHGGMTGYWSLEKGGRLRNHCLHCHDPHYPKYQIMLPVHSPKDRFLHKTEAHE